MVAADNDDAGRAAVERLQKHLGHLGVAKASLIRISKEGQDMNDVVIGGNA